MRWIAPSFALCAVVCLGCGARPARPSSEGGGGGSGGSDLAARGGESVGGDGSRRDSDGGSVDELIAEMLDTSPEIDAPDREPGPSIEIDIAREAGVVSVGAAPLPAAERRARSRRETARYLALAEPEASRPDTATDGTSAPLLVRTARFLVAVDQVRETIAAVRDVAVALGGFVARETDDTIVIRVPVERFDEAVALVAGTGEVVRREIRTTDVGEELHDNDTRIRTLEAMMARLAELLARAADVPGALAVERELERVTLELERLRGRQRYLADRVAYATLAVELRELVEDEIDHVDRVVLPFGWLRELGLSRLLRLE